MQLNYFCMLLSSTFLVVLHSARAVYRILGAVHLGDCYGDYFDGL